MGNTDKQHRKTDQTTGQFKLRVSEKLIFKNQHSKDKQSTAINQICGCSDFKPVCFDLPDCQRDYKE